MITLRLTQSDLDRFKSDFELRAYLRSKGLETRQMTCKRDTASGVCVYEGPRLTEVDQGTSTPCEVTP